MSNINCRSCFVVLNNPRYNITYKHSEDGQIVKDDNNKPVELSREENELTKMTDEEICKNILDRWVKLDEENRTGAVLMCESAEGLEHLHIVYCSKKKFRPFSAVKKLFKKAPHIEITKGTKEDVESYINKTGKFAEKGEIVKSKAEFGELIGCQGKRNDLITLDEIKELINNGKTPKEIYWEYPKALKESKAVDWLFFNYRAENTPALREVNVHWLFGKSGCGKSYTYIELVKLHGEENVYIVSDYDNPFDMYNGEPIVFFDEFRGQIKYSVLLTMLDCYKQQVRCRYQNKLMLWTEVYITSPYLPYELYQNIKDRDDKHDKLTQLIRRIDTLQYCFAVDDNESIAYCKYSLDVDINGCGDDYREICSSVNNDITFNIQRGLIGLPNCDISFVEKKKQIKKNNNAVCIL